MDDGNVIQCRDCFAIFMRYEDKTPEQRALEIEALAKLKSAGAGEGIVQYDGMPGIYIESPTSEANHEGLKALNKKGAARINLKNPGRRPPKPFRKVK